MVGLKRDFYNIDPICKIRFRSDYGRIKTFSDVISLEVPSQFRSDYGRIKTVNTLVKF